MCSRKILLIDLQGEHRQKEERVIFDNALHLVQCLLRTGQSIPLPLSREDDYRQSALYIK